MEHVRAADSQENNVTIFKERGKGGRREEGGTQSHGKPPAGAGME